jgi:IS1 family transposase
LELDEVWSYVGSKDNPVWLWIALCRRTRQVVAWHHGSRSMLCCRALWEKIPPAYKQGLVFTDFWKAYQEVVPDNQHRPAPNTKDKLTTWSASTSPSGSASAGSLEKPSPSPKATLCTKSTSEPSSDNTTLNALLNIKHPVALNHYRNSKWSQPNE